MCGSSQSSNRLSTFAIYNCTLLKIVAKHNWYRYKLNNTIIKHPEKKSHNFCNKLLLYIYFLCVTGVVANEK